MAILEVNSANFQAQVLEAEKPILVDFWGPGCLPCTMMAPVLEKVAEKYQETLLVGKLNVAENPEMMEQYPIMGVPTLFVFKGGEILDTIVGFMPQADLEASLKEILA